MDRLRGRGWLAGEGGGEECAVGFDCGVEVAGEWVVDDADDGLEGDGEAEGDGDVGV